MSRFLLYVQRLVFSCFHTLQQSFFSWTRPPKTSLLLGTVADLARAKSELIAENAFVRQQLVILLRQSKRPACTKVDRILLVLLARAIGTWRQALLIVQPETLLRWHRLGFRLFWKHTSKAASHTPKLTAETIALIKDMARTNRLWGAERIRGALLKLGIHVCNRTIQKYMRHVRTPRPGRQKWATFLHHHAAEFWACDFLQVTDPFFRSLFAFFVIELKSRKVIHMAFTKFPTDAWVAQQLREATPYGQVPKYLMHDHDTQFGPAFARRAATSSIQILRTPYHAPCANTVCERFLGSVRRECLDHILVLHENHVYRVLQDDVEYFNHARPHQGIKQEIPEPQGSPVPHDHTCGQVIALPILGGLHHNYRRTA